MPSEFDLIARYFNRLGAERADVALGVGDDAAILDVPPGQQLIVTVDTLIEGVHFPAHTAAEDIGHKTLAVNLSDLAAMGAQPAWATLALTLPSANEDWLKNFAAGFNALAEQHGVSLIGGDTTRGPLSITVQMLGLAPTGQALRRGGAKPGDLIYVTGTLGDAGAGLGIAKGELQTAQPARDYLLGRLNRPTPRVQQGMRLRALATAAIDISDGLAADLGHILEQSGAGALIHSDALPLSQPLRESVGGAEAVRLALTAGDDYELCFTIPPQRQDALHTQAEKQDCPLTCIGRIETTPGLRCINENGQPCQINKTGYDHFATE